MSSYHAGMKAVRDPFTTHAVLAALALGALAVGSARAQVPPSVWPRCIAERDGQQLGLAGSVCECKYERGGTLTGRPPGWRWSCDIMRMDGSSLGLPADTSAGRQSLPPGFTYAPQGAAQPGLNGWDSAPFNPRAPGR